MPESLTATVIDKNHSQLENTTLIQVDHPEDFDGVTLKQNLAMGKKNIMRYLESFAKRLVPEQLPNGLAGKNSVFSLMITMFLFAVASFVVITQTPTYLMYRFHWPDSKLSSLYTIAGISRLISLTFLLPIVKRLAPRSVLTDPVASINFDLKVVVVGLLIETFTFFMYGITPVGEGFYLGAIISSIGTMFSPAVRGIITQSVAPELLGSTMGTLATFESLAFIGAPLLSGLLYGATLETWPSAVFYVAGILSLVSTLFVLFIYIRHARSMHHRY
ncbi:hypothetical protein BGX27_001274 [Mortierella sp. AM989]|nr:hypothetical protein BGX27_001274 [Mortierella sp. AM989]